MKLSSGRGGMIGVMAAAAIVLLGVVAFTVGPKAFGQQGKGTLNQERPDKQGETIVGKVILRAKDTDCMQDLAQVRQAIEIATDPVEGTKPQSLEDLKLPASMLVCPIGKEKYVYDAATGTVHCPHPGHEKY